MSPDRPVYIIDDDPDVCRSLELLLTLEGAVVRTWVCAELFLADLDRLSPGFIVSDVCMPGIDGVMLLEAVRARGRRDPVIVISGEADVPLAVRALKAGAADFIEKPFDSDALMLAIAQAHREVAVPALAMIGERIAKLSKREREVLDRLIDGATNKRIAYELNISARTVEIYRAKLMDKMQATSLSRLVRMGVEAGLGGEATA